MTPVGALARAVLLAYPAEFRAQFGKEILADLDDDPSDAGRQLFDLFRGAVAMHFDAIARDASYALRRLRSAPLFVAIVVLAFALGIGANVAVFSVLDAVVLRPLPFAHASSLAVVTFRGASGAAFPAISVTDASDLQAQSRTVSAIAAATYDQPTLIVGGKPYTLNGLDVTPNYFSILGIRPQLGRGLTAADAQPGTSDVVIRNRLWRERFGADPSVVGRTITLQGRPARIVGVLRPAQLLVDPNGGLMKGDLLEAIAQPVDPRNRGNRTSGGVALLAPGAGLAQANAEFALISSRLQKLYPKSDASIRFSLVPLTASVLGSAGPVLWIVFAAVAGILLIACANVGNLLAARWSSRDREFAVRRALGASSASIARQLLVETGLLAAIGAAIGTLAAWGVLRGLAPAAAHALPRAGTIGIDGTALLYAFGVLIAATLLAGVLPLFSLRSADLLPALKSAGRGGDASRRNGLRSALIVVEVALALALVTMSALMVRNFVALVHTPLGIRSHGVVVADDVSMTPGNGFVNEAESPHFDPQQAALLIERELLARLRALPGVESAALAMTYPLGDVEWQTSARVAGRSYPPGAAPVAWSDTVSPGYFRTLGIALIRGRDFTAADTRNSAPVAIVNEAFAAQYLSGMQAIGAHLYLPPLKRAARIVGVVSNERDSLTTPASPEFYQPAEQAPEPFTGAVIYAPHLAPAVVEREVQGAFAKTMPLQQPPDLATVSQLLGRATARERFATMLLSVLAVIALLLALAGIFGVVSFSVTQRLHEFGIRIALGATAGNLVADVLRRAFATTAAGVAVGLGLAAFAAHAISGQLGAISPFDPATFAIVIVLIFLCAAAASLQPALRATRVAPNEALRYE
jgi:predicted permease